MAKSIAQKVAWGFSLAMTLGWPMRPAAAAEGNEMSSEQVRKMFATNCSWCHGDFGKKAGKGGPKLAGTEMTEKQIHDRIFNGAPGGAMPSYKKMLTDEEINALAIYIKTRPAE